MSESPLRLLRLRNFAFLWAGAVASAAGSSIGYVVLIWLVYAATKSPLAIALLGVVEFLPAALLGLFAGAAVDRFDRRRLMVLCDAARSLLLGGLAAWVLYFGANVAIALAVAFVVSGLGTLFRPASGALLPRLVGNRELTDANGLLESGGSAASFLGGPVGGFLVVAFGTAAGLAVNSLTYALAGTLLTLMVLPLATERRGTPSVRRETSLLTEAREGLRYLRSQRGLLYLTLSGMGSNFFISVFAGFEVFYVTERLHLNAAALGILLAANTAGFALGAMFPARLPTFRAPGTWTAVSWGGAGLCIVGVALSTSLLPAVVFVLASATLSSFGNVVIQAATQRVVPDRLVGRVLATSEAASYAMIPLGQIAGGLTLLHFGVVLSYLAAGVGSSLAAFLLLFSSAVRGWAREGPLARPASGEPSS